jgi:hypothetical protein
MEDLNPPPWRGFLLRPLSRTYKLFALLGYFYLAYVGLLEHFKENLIGLESTRLHFLSYSTLSVNGDEGANFYYGFLHLIVFETKQKRYVFVFHIYVRTMYCTYSLSNRCQVIFIRRKIKIQYGTLF